MHLIYLDEVKYHPPDQKYHLLSGLALSESSLVEADGKLAKIADEYFGIPLLSDKTEFHAKHITHGKGPFKGHEIENRLKLFKDLMDCIDSTTGILKIEILVDPSKIVAEKDPSDCAFMFFVEQANSLMKRKNSYGILIADDDSEKKASNVDSLSNYKAFNTDWLLSRPIDNLLDTIHHTKSHHSRFIQLADIYVYICSLQYKEQVKYVQKTLISYAESETNLLKRDAVRHWPTEQSIWYQRHKNSQQMASE